MISIRTFLTRHLHPSKLLPLLRVNHPRPILPWRVVADVTAVAAVEVGDPVTVFVLVKADDVTLHGRSVLEVERLC